MKALSLRQPWANAVLYLGKTIENRVWPPPATMLGVEFLIHASKTMAAWELEDATEFCEDVLGVAECYAIERAFGIGDELLPAHLTVRPLHRGGIVGRARLVDVVEPRPESTKGDVRLHYPTAYRSDDVRAPNWRWHMRAQFGFVLEDVKATPFVPCLGMLGFWEVPASLLTELLKKEAEQ